MTEPDDRRCADRLASHVDDVVLRRLTSYCDDRGTLTEPLRNSWDLGLPPAQWSFEVARTMPPLAEIERFLAHVNGGPAPLSSAQDGLLVVERAAAIERLLAVPARRGA